jgi:hypothetical protein
MRYRDTYDKIMAYGQQIAGHPKVQQAASTAQTKANELAKTAAAKAPDYAKGAAKTAQAQVSQVPKYVSSAKQAATSAKQAATSKLPARFGGAHSTSGHAADGSMSSAQDDVAPDGNLVYPVDGSSPSVNGIRYTPDTP